MIERLSARLRSETRPRHIVARATLLARAFLAARPAAHVYAIALARMEPVYGALEHAIDACDEPLLRAFHRPELHRLEAIRRDLELVGRPSTAPSSLYASRVRLVAQRSPIALLGHFYVRHLRDLEASTLAACVAPRCLGLPEGTRLAYFEFPSVRDLAECRAELTAYLDAVPHAHHAAILDEARRAVALHRELVDAFFEDLAPRDLSRPQGPASMGAR